VPDIDDQTLLADGFEDAFLGVTCGIHPQEECAVYSRKACIEILMSDGTSYEDAVEYFEFNVAGAYVGERTPIFITQWEQHTDG
jgi:hypothetical protein